MSYSKEQIMLALSYVSYLGLTLNESHEENEKLLLEIIEQGLASWPPIKGQWQLAWGPALFVLPGTSFADSMMFVVRNIEDPAQYVIVIRGTNPVSIPNWLIWDFQGKELKDWHYGLQPEGSHPKISESSYFGLMILQTLRPSAGIPGEKQSLLEFLNCELDAIGKKSAVSRLSGLMREEKQGQAKICVTGHSLGGALSSMVALWLKDVQGEQLASNATLSTVTFAGPTAGNADFAEQLDRELAGHCQRIANSLDFVCHAWETASLQELYTLYGALLPMPALAVIIKKLIADSEGKEYKHFASDAPPLEGKFKKIAIPYIVQALYQHVFAYPKLMGLKKKDIPMKEIMTVLALVDAENVTEVLSAPASLLKRFM